MIKIRKTASKDPTVDAQKIEEIHSLIQVGDWVQVPPEEGKPAKKAKVLATELNTPCTRPAFSDSGIVSWPKCVVLVVSSVMRSCRG